MFASVQKHDQFHLFFVASHVLRVTIEIVLKGLHFLEELCEILYLAVLTGIRVTSIEEICENNPFLINDVFLFLVK